MRRIVMAVMMLAVAGCSGDGVGQPEPSLSRLDVTPRLRVACPGVTDGEIDALIVLTNQIRLLGADKTEQLSHAIENCIEIAFDPTVCMTCNTAIIDQVFGPN